jgi:protein-tyrosine phosphatase
LRFYQKAMRRPKSKVLCMCHHGICRSASLTYFFLRVDGFSPAKAKSTVLKARRRARVVPAYQRSGEDFRSLYKMQQIIKSKHTKS